MIYTKNVSIIWFRVSYLLSAIRIRRAKELHHQQPRNWDRSSPRNWITLENILKPSMKSSKHSPGVPDSHSWIAGCRTVVCPSDKNDRYQGPGFTSTSGWFVAIFCYCSELCNWISVGLLSIRFISPFDLLKLGSGIVFSKLSNYDW